MLALGERVVEIGRLNKLRTTNEKTDDINFGLRDSRKWAALGERGIGITRFA